MERAYKYYRYLLIVASVAYVALLLYLYFVRGFQGSFSRTIFNRTDSYSSELFNFIPFKNIIFYFSRIGTNKMNTNIIVFNLLYVVLAWIPAGYFACSFFTKVRFWMKSIYFVIGVTVMFGIRVFMLAGFFDVDKIMQAYLGFVIGFGICFGLGKLLQSTQLRAHGRIKAVTEDIFM